MDLEAPPPNRVWFTFRRAAYGSGFWTYSAECTGHREETYQWLVDQVGPENTAWMWVPVSNPDARHDGFFLFDDPDTAIMFKLTFG